MNALQVDRGRELADKAGQIQYLQAQGVKSEDPSGLAVKQFSQAYLNESDMGIYVWRK